MSRHVAAPSPIMLAAEECEEATCVALRDARSPIPLFDAGRHCEPLPSMCVLESDGVGIFIRHECGMGVERLAVSA